MLLSRMVEFSICCRQYTPLLVGLCVGISISLFFSSASVRGNGCQREDASALTASNAAYNGNGMDLPIQADDGSYKIYQDVEDDSSDYEPRINLAGKPHSAKKEPRTFVRPRYYSTELGIREKIFVAVLSSIKQIPSLGLAINATLSHHVNRLAFFVEVSPTDKLDIKTLPVVGFKDSQQGLLTLHTLKYLSDKLAQGYNYFFIVKDSTFVNGRILKKLMDHVSVNEDVYMGVVGNEPTSNPTVCALDSGILLSNSVLQALSPLLESCNEDYAFNSDDEKIGLCVYRALKLNCQSQFQNQTFTTFNLDEQVSDVLQLEQTWETNPDLPRALTSFHARDPAYFYMLNKLSAASSLKEVERSIVELQQSILRLAPQAPGGLDAIPWPIGYSPAAKVDSRFSIIRWDYFNATHVFFDTEHNVVRPMSRAHLEDIKEVTEAAVAEVQKEHPEWAFSHLIDGYKRFDPVRGMDYLMDLLFMDPSGREIVHRMEGCRPITHVDTVPMPYVTESGLVHIVVILGDEDQLEAADKFSRAFAKNMAAKADKSEMTLLVPDQESFTPLKTSIQSLNQQSKKQGIHMITYKSASNNVPAGLEFLAADLVSNRLGPDALIFLCNPFTEIYPDVLNRIRINTISGWQLYSPIPFAEYNPQVVHFPADPPKVLPALNITTNQGIYDSHDTSHISFYAADYLNARKTFELEMPLIKSENGDPNDWNQELPYESVLSMFSRLRKLHVLRAVEPHLRVRYHSRHHCSIDRCRQSTLISQGTRSQLAQFALDKSSRPASVDDLMMNHIES